MAARRGERGFIKGERETEIEEREETSKVRIVLQAPGKGTKVQISVKSHEAKYRRRSLEVVSLGRTQNNHDARLTISLG